MAPGLQAVARVLYAHGCFSSFSCHRRNLEGFERRRNSKYGRPKLQSAALFENAKIVMRTPSAVREFAWNVLSPMWSAECLKWGR